MTEFLVMLGVVFGGAALIFIYIFIYNYIKDAQFRGKSMEGKAESLMKKDLSPGYARYTFYQCHNYNKAYSQSEWKILYEIVQIATKEMDKDSKEYAELVAPFINAIVVDESGYYARRGMENLAGRLHKFMPGVNDSVSLNYFVEPYKYVKDEQRAVESEQAEQAAAQERAQRVAASQEEAKYMLTQAEKKEIERAEANYNRAVRLATDNPNSDYRKMDEKRAYAEYMRVLAKYAGKK